ENTARGVEIDMPRGPTGTLAQARRRMAEALEQGATADAAARASGLTRRTAYRMRKKDPRQLPLL
ncbi:helix-turn-helix domain-containing protein, partial [Starkeya nomas]